MRLTEPRAVFLSVVLLAGALGACAAIDDTDDLDARRARSARDIPEEPDAGVLEVRADGADAGSDAAPPKTHQPLLKGGLHPDASDGLRALGIPASRIMQTIGNAPASAGTHARDGYVDGVAYGAAVDISTRDMDFAALRTLLDGLATQGFAAWYRRPGYDGWPADESPHIHAVYVGCAMKSILQAQVADWLVGKNGLASHTTYTFHTWPVSARTAIEALFEKYN